MSQLTLTGDQVPIKKKDPQSELTPAERRIWNYLRRLGAQRTEKEIHKIFTDLSTIGNKLRSMRAKGYARSIPQRDGPQKWEAVI